MIDGGRNEDVTRRRDFTAGDDETMNQSACCVSDKVDKREERRKDGSAAQPGKTDKSGVCRRILSVDALNEGNEANGGNEARKSSV